MAGTIGLAVGVLVVVMTFSGLIGVTAPTTPDQNSLSNPSSGTGGHTFPTPIRHVFLIIMENEETGVIYDTVPYETQLANTYGWGGDANTSADHIGYYAICHPSAPNYLALTSGQPLQCGTDAYNTYPVNNLGNLLETAGLPWADYEESATVPCQDYTSGPAAGPYVVKHNPFVYYSDLDPSSPTGACAQHSIPIANVTADYPYSATPPAFTYIAPNETDDAHNTNQYVGDQWLASFVPKLEAQPWFSSSVVFITYDEAYNASGDEVFTGPNGLQGGPVYTVAVSPYTIGMGPLSYNTSHYNLLTTIEWLLGLPGTGTGNDSTVQYPVMAQLFQPRLFGPDVDLEGTDLKGVDLAAYNLAGDNFANADLQDADLQEADLQEAHLQDANLAGADLQGANLQGARLTDSNLAGADLQGTNFQGANLEHADLLGATLTGFGPVDPTDFDYASLFQAELTNAVCGKPNYILAAGANIDAVGVPAACVPPL